MNPAVTDFPGASKLSSLLAKNYAQEIFTLLVNYQDISASEVAARLDLHIKTAQDFLDGLAELGIVEKTEVIEKVRPYFRYNLAVRRIAIDIDLETIKVMPAEDYLSIKIREAENSGARYSMGRSEEAFSSVIIWSGTGRERSERRLKLTTAQGRFLYHLPFPKAEPLTIAEIMHKAGLEPAAANEILDIVQLLQGYGVIA